MVSYKLRPWYDIVWYCFIVQHTSLTHTTVHTTVLVLTRIESIPWTIIIHTKTNPLCHNLLFTLKNWTSRMFGKTSICDTCIWIDVWKKYSTSNFWLDVYTCITKVCMTCKMLIMMLMLMKMKTTENEYIVQTNEQKNKWLDVYVLMWEKSWVKQKTKHTEDKTPYKETIMKTITKNKNTFTTLLRTTHFRNIAFIERWMNEFEIFRWIEWNKNAISK